MEDCDIIKLFFARNEDAITEFGLKYKKLCSSVAYGITGTRENTEECYSDLCMKLWNAIPPENPQSLKAYAVRIIRNISLNLIKREGAAKRRALLVELDECEAETAIHGGEDGTELKELIEDFLSTLDKESARIFLMRYLYAVRVKDIAAKIGINENRVSKSLGKTRAALKKYLEERGVNVK